MIPFYQLNLGLLASANAYLLYRQYAREQQQKTKSSSVLPVPESPTDDDAAAASSSSDRDVESEARDDADGSSAAATKAAARGFQRDFLVVYALAMAADWLQVPCPLFPTTPLSPIPSISAAFLI